MEAGYAQLVNFQSLAVWLRSVFSRRDILRMVEACSVVMFYTSGGAHVSVHSFVENNRPPSFGLYRLPVLGGSSGGEYLQVEQLFKMCSAGLT